MQTKKSIVDLLISFEALFVKSGPQPWLFLSKMLGSFPWLFFCFSILAPFTILRVATETLSLSSNVFL